MTNVIDLSQVRVDKLDPTSGEDSPFLAFLESIREGRFSPKAAVYYVEDDENIAYGITRTKKADQIKMLYSLKRILEQIIDTYPDEDDVENEVVS